MGRFLVERRTHADTPRGAVGVVVGRGVAGGGARAAGGSGTDRSAARRRRVVVADRRAVALGVRADRAACAERGTPDDRDGDVRAPDGPQGALWLGVSDPGWRGVGLAASAAFLPDRPVRAGTGRVDDQKAHAPGRARDGE